MQVDPILERGKPAGSTLLVLAADARTLIVSVPLKRGGSQAYYDAAVCAPST